MNDCRRGERKVHSRSRSLLVAQAHAINWNTDHPGCLVSGFLLVNRVPGNFHIMAYSKNHNLNTAATNLSLTVNHLSFGIPLTDDQKKRLDRLDVTYHQTNPLDGKQVGAR